MFRKKEEKPQFSEGLKEELKKNSAERKINFDKKKIVWVFVTIVLIVLLIFILWQSYSFDRRAKTENQDVANSIREENSASSTNPEKEERKEEVQTQESYTVAEGDTLSTIAEKFGISWQKLAEANNLTEEGTLRIGQKLIIPKE